MERNARIFEDRELEVADIYEKVEFSFSLWASGDKAFKNFPFSLFVQNRKDVMGPWGELGLLRSLSCPFSVFNFFPEDTIASSFVIDLTNKKRSFLIKK